MRARGRFVVLEGLDGAGTTTQAKRLVASLRRRGRRAVLTREPSDGPIGLLIRQSLLNRGRRLPEDALALLFAADRLDHLASTIEPGLASGAVVVSDRYVLSSFAYQGRSLEMAWVEAINARARPPDLTLFLEVSLKVSAARRRLRGGPAERFDDARTQRAVARAYSAVMTRHSGVHRVRWIDGDASVEMVADQVRSAVSRLLERTVPAAKRRGRQNH